MKLIYSCENHFLIANAKNIVEGMGIATFIKNEFATGAIGEISAFDCWPELWIVNDSDYDKATEAIAAMTPSESASTWVCSQCLEVNEPSFEFCWNCQHET
jgi:hypothetical protein